MNLQPVTCNMKGTLIVTGSSRGIGAAVALAAADAGYSVVVNYVQNELAANKLVDQIRVTGRTACAIRADIGRESDVLHLFQRAEQELGPIQALVNNAGITGGFARVDEVDSTMLERLMAINVIGPILCAREAVKRMSTRYGKMGGVIVNISSLASRTGAGGEWVHYAATKGAMNSFTIGLAREVAAEGIRVNAVSPGLVETDIHSAAGEPERLQRLTPTIPMKRAGLPEEVAAGVIWLLSSAASYVTGTILEIGGGR
jgi:NAD(P)-dependent dehydrogenase (short-subunit alcohol dehydrogenase family)